MLQFILEIGVMHQQIVGRGGRIGIEVGIIGCVFSLSEYLVISSPCEKHSSTQNGQDNLKVLLVNVSALTLRRTDQGLSPWWEMVHGLAVPLWRSLGDGQVRLHDE